MSRRVLRYGWLVTMFLLAGPMSVYSQPRATQRPWQRDVSERDRHLAETLFAQAVELHEQLLRDHAVTRYEEALSHWDHPDIRWNLALLMKEMGQYLRSYEHLERALAWGPEAFDEPEWDRLFAMRQALLQQHLAVVEARCDQPGAELALDGKPWFRGPGEARQVVLPGEHVVTAEKPGYIPVAKNILLLAGVQGVVTVSMSIHRIFKRRWKPWVPLVVLGSGVAVTGVGGWLYAAASSEYEKFDEAFSNICMNGGCNDAEVPDIRDQLDRARTLETTARISLLAGGVTVATGIALVLLNQVTAPSREDGPTRSFVVPTLNSGGVGISVGMSF